MVSKTSLLHIISDERTSNLFKSIALTQGDVLISRLKLTRRQYYSSIFLLKQAGLVKRQKGVYLLTVFGRVFYNAVTDLETKLEDALNNYWKLKAIDAIQLSSIEESKEVIYALIDDQEIRRLLLNEAPQRTAVNHQTRSTAAHRRKPPNKKIGDMMQYRQ